METTRKFARTMEEAFGPYHRGNLWVERDPGFDRADLIVMTACGFALVALAVILYVWN